MPFGRHDQFLGHGHGHGHPDDVHGVQNRDPLASGEAAGLPVVGDPDRAGEFRPVLNQRQGLRLAEVLEGAPRVTGEDQPP
ncbi:hypothetical protein SANT12839_075660 [Streptomyces antimycoticus]|uniref:Uncharacterized protein n=1 Tax=Streptomyces antimycoticus TaxID=68175 RepID=A0A4D4KEV2_9ACTN|nr:hypothetical protein SANT12839_075660 [Streptomyces antimycoticus]